MAAAAQKPCPTEAKGQCTGSFWSSCKMQSSRTWFLFLHLTTALLPESCMRLPLHPPISQKGRTLLPAPWKHWENKIINTLKHFESITRVFTEMPVLLNPVASLRALLWCCRGNYNVSSQLCNAVHGDRNCFLISLAITFHPEAWYSIVLTSACLTVHNIDCKSTQPFWKYAHLQKETIIRQHCKIKTHHHILAHAW